MDLQVTARSVLRSFAGMQIYTRTGDDGTTGLFGGGRIAKNDLRIEAYGTLDELNVHVGAFADHAELPEEDRTFLRQIQSDLFAMGSHLATVGDEMRQHLPPLPLGRISEMESWMDDAMEALPALTAFVLPGGHPMVSAAHLCRVVCRRAERRVIGLAGSGDNGAHEGEVDPGIAKYLNRLSDVFFVWGRRTSQLAGVDEILWKSKD